jgi:hypothetical protein
MRILLVCLLIAFVSTAFGQTKSIKVYFLYGSKPAKGYKKTEKKRFGGIHGGHASIGIGNEIVGFGPKGKFHIFPKKKENHSHFRSESLSSFAKDSVGNKYTVITIPVTNEQYDKVKSIHGDYCSAPPYDYAFLGMRCAAATYDILSQANILKPKGRIATIYSIFYPKRLLKRMLRLANEKGYKVHTQPGHKSRKWEKD